MRATSPLTLGVDIGGANLKYADTDGHAASTEFPLWMRPDDLATQLIADLAGYSSETQLVATMTGELADCFLDRREGVCHIVEQFCRAASRSRMPSPLFYAVDGTLHDDRWSVEHVDLVAAANWHALANYLARTFASRLSAGGLLVDIGSTTTDVIPLKDDTVATTSRTDVQRLAEGSLVYLGGGRTPVCSLVDHLRWNDQTVPVMREVFATMDDVRLLLGFASPDASDCRSADGKPRDTFHAANRMARMIGLDHRAVDLETAADFARQVHRRAREIIADAIAGFDTTGPLLISGHCNDLLPDDLLTGVGQRREQISIQKMLGEQVSRCAPAYAVARLAAAQLDAQP